MSTKAAYVNARIHTGDPVVPFATVLRVDGGAVASVGFDRPDPGEGWTIIDLEGRSVMPGFVDGHVHPLLGGGRERGCDVSGLPTVEDYWSRIREFTRMHPGDGLLVVTGYSAILVANTHVTRVDLDAVTGDRPVLMINSDQHGALANTAALRRAGILNAAATAQDPHIEKSPDGTPTGLINEEAIQLVRQLAGPPNEDDAAQDVLAAQAVLHRFGVVGWQDALLGSEFGTVDVGRVYLQLAADDRLTGRVSGAIYWDRTRGLEQLDSIIERREIYSRGRFRAPTVKMLLDGVHEAGTAAMFENYFDADGAPLGHNGGTMIEPEDLNRAVVALDAHGFDVHFHALGDRAVREALDAVQSARVVNGHRGTRHQIAHLTFVATEDLPRFRALDVTANLQLVWTANDFLDFAQYEKYVGSEAMSRMSQLATWNDYGIHWSAGSDWPVSSPNPFDAIQAGVHRSLRGEAPESLRSQRLPLSTALAAYTSGSSYSSRLDRNGVLRAGMNADFVVLGDDPFSLENVSDCVVQQTIVGGETVYSAT